MMWLLQILVFGHVHKWQILTKTRYVDYANYVDEKDVLARGMQYTLQCEKCGRLKEHKS